MGNFDESGVHRDDKGKFAPVGEGNVSAKAVRVLASKARVAEGKGVKASSVKRLAKGKKDDGGEKKLNSHQQRALNALRREAKAAGATLQNNGEGNLDPSLVLNVMRRDGMKCAECGSREELTIHHKANLENPTKYERKFDPHGKRPRDLVTWCAEDHEERHEEDHEETLEKKNG